MTSLLSYLDPAEVLPLCKLAEEARKGRALSAAKAIVIPSLGFVGGTGLGLGAGFVADEIAKRVSGAPVSAPLRRTIAPAVTAGLSLAYGLYKAKELEDLRRAFEGHPNQSIGRG